MVRRISARNNTSATLPAAQTSTSASTRRPNVPSSWSRRPAAASHGGVTLKLAVADLERSGLTLAQAAAEGIHPVEDASAVNSDFAAAPALILPYYDAQRRPLTYLRDGRATPFCRARYLAPPGFPVPKGRRYDQPNDSGTPPYFPRSFDWQKVERGEVDACALVEGEKKSAALLALAGIPTIAIGGVYNFKDGAAALHPDLAKIAAHCPDIYILFDSDRASNPQIQVAEWRLAGQLALLGTRVHVVSIPPDGDKKVGADDYLVQHGPAALSKLILDTPALGEQPAAVSSPDEITVAQILKREVVPVEELIPGWLEKGIPNFLAGPGGVHKSRLALQWGLCLNAGAAVWSLGAGLEGLRAPKATLVFCSAEDDANELARRAQAICSALKLKSQDRGMFIARKGKDSALVYMHESAEVEIRPFYHELVNRLRGLPGHKIVVLDSAYDFVRFVGRAKIDEDAVNYFIKVILQGVCDQTDSTLLIPWHPSQAGSERDSMDGWSVAWHNAPRARLALKAEKDIPDTYTLSVAKRNHGRKGDPLTLKFCEGALLPLNAVPDDGKLAAFHQAVVSGAIAAARVNVPCNRRHANDRVFEEAAKALGRRPSPKEVLRELERAVEVNELIFLSGTSKRASGFYPPDKEAAIAMSLATRRAGKPGSGSDSDA